MNADPSPDRRGPTEAQPPRGEVSGFDQRLETLRDRAGSTLNQIEDLAAQVSLEGAAQDALERAADAEYDRTLELFWPRFSADAHAVKLSSVDPQVLGNIVVSPTAAGPVKPGTVLVAAPFSFRVPDSSIGVHAALTIPLSDYALKLAPARRGLAAQRAAVGDDAVAARRRARVAAVELFYGKLRAEAALAVVEQAHALAVKNLAAAKARVDAGAGSKAEVAAFEAQVARSELSLVATKDAVRLTGERLDRLLMLPDGQAVTAKEDLLAPLPAMVPNREALTEQALSSRAELKALDERMKALDAQATVQRASYFPRLDGAAEATYANPNQRYFPPPDAFKPSAQVGVQLSWSLTDAVQAGAAVRATDAQRAAVEAQRAAFVQQIKVDLFDLADRVESVETQLSASAHALDAAGEALRVRERLYENGAGTSTELLDAQNTFVAAQFAALEARVEQRRARRLLELATQ
ncbi:MAG: TolC family protein [Myxococcaceae bacterium]